MGEDYAVQFGGVKTKVTVSSIGFHSFSLVHTAIKKDGMSRIGGYQMLASRYLACSAYKLYLHSNAATPFVLSHFLTFNRVGLIAADDIQMTVFEDLCTL